MMDAHDAPRPLRVLLVTDTDKPIGALRDALARLHYEMLDEVATPARLPAVVEKERPDVVIIDTESPSRDTLEQLAVMHARAPRPVLMFSPDADQQLIRAAVGAGVSAYLVEGLSPERLAPIIEVALRALLARRGAAPAPGRGRERAGRPQADRSRQAPADGDAPARRAGCLCHAAPPRHGPGHPHRRSRAADPPRSPNSRW